MRIIKYSDAFDELFDLDYQIESLKELVDAEPEVLVLTGDDCKGWRNVPNSGKYKWKNGTWKAYWEKYSKGRKWPFQCRMKYCTDCAEDGAHIFQKDGKQYIIPMCAHFNRGRSDELFDVNVGTVAVEVDRSQVIEVND